MRHPVALPLLAIAIALPLCSCQATKDALVSPKLAAMDAAAIAPQQQQQQQLIRAYASHDQSGQPASANSLWRVGARTFFNDQRAAKVGDILTVLISIDDSAQVSDDTNRQRTTANTVNMANFLGLETALGRILPKGYNPANAINTGANSSLAGTASINRAEKISLTVAAVVTKVMPNGNLVIQGRQEVKTNNELRELTVTGIVRPEDISSSNTINHTQIAEARINYGGRGDLSRTQKAPVGQALMEEFSPF